MDLYDNKLSVSFLLAPRRSSTTVSLATSNFVVFVHLFFCPFLFLLRLNVKYPIMSKDLILHILANFSPKRLLLGMGWDCGKEGQNTSQWAPEPAHSGIPFPRDPNAETLSVVCNYIPPVTKKIKCNEVK